MVNNYDYIYEYYLGTSPIGTHRANLTDVKSYCDTNSGHSYIHITFYIDSLNKHFMYGFRKSNSFLSEHSRFLNMLKNATDRSFSSISDLIGECFNITIAVSPYYDEKEKAYLKIKNIESVKEVK